MTSETPNCSIVVLGSTMRDLFSYAERFPTPGETLKGNSFRMDFGGKGANQAVTAARLGGSVAMVTKLGKDKFGEEIKENFISQGIDTSQVTWGEKSTGLANIFVDGQGQNCIVIIPGANHELNIGDVENAAGLIKQAKILMTQLEINLETTATALKLAHNAGVTTIFNPAPAMALPPEIYPHIDILCPNEAELELLSGMKVSCTETATAAAKKLIDLGIKQVVCTLGEKGSLLVTKDQLEYVPCEKVQVVDTTGAGDCFLGSFAVFLSQGDTITVAMKKASHVATMSVQKQGTQSSFPHRSEVPTDFFTK